MYSAVVLAGGKGSRFGGSTPKQYIPVLGRPLIYYSLVAFERSKVSEVILVTDPADTEYIKSEILKKYGIIKVAAFAPGGKERYESVYNGLKCVNEDHVLIHDGARALITPEEIDLLCEASDRTGAAIAAVKSTDTVKLTDGGDVISDTPSRSRVWCAMTPQAFETGLIKEAYGRLMADGDAALVTDDASVVERYTDREVSLIEVSHDNIKVTRPTDVVIVESVLQMRGFQA